jgi:hypothetical protein
MAKTGPGAADLSATAFEPPTKVSRGEIIETSEAVLAMPDVEIQETEDIFRLPVLGMDWDMGVMVYAPEDTSKIPSGADGKRIGVFLLHGGAGDYKAMEVLARLLAGKFGYKVVSMTYPGRLYLLDPSRDWPGDTINADGTVRTPIWQKEEAITPDQYDVVKDTSKRKRYGTRTVARAKPGTRFYHRLAAWPVAFEEGMKDACRRHLPEDTFSIFVHGHSTGGPIVCMLSQRVANIAGAIAVENSSFGYINQQKHAWSGSLGKIAGFDKVAKTDDTPKEKLYRTDPFNELYIRSWRDRARYAGPEVLGQEGPSALMRLPWLMEEVLERWEVEKLRPAFKAEYIITHNVVPSLREAARVSAERLAMDDDETEALIARYLGYARELSGPDAKPVPPFLFSITKDSRDHSPEVYKEVIVPMFTSMKPAPKVRVVHFGAGVHRYTAPEKDLPMGVAPAVARLWHDAFRGGFFLP